MKLDTEQSLKLELLCKDGSECELNSWPISQLSIATSNNTSVENTI